MNRNPPPSSPRGPFDSWSSPPPPPPPQHAPGYLAFPSPHIDSLTSRISMNPNTTGEPFGFVHETMPGGTYLHMPDVARTGQTTRYNAAFMIPPRTRYYDPRRAYPQRSSHHLNQEPRCHHIYPSSARAARHLSASSTRLVTPTPLPETSSVSRTVTKVSSSNTIMASGSPSSSKKRVRFCDDDADYHRRRCRHLEVQLVRYRRRVAQLEEDTINIGLGMVQRTNILGLGVTQRSGQASESKATAKKIMPPTQISLYDHLRGFQWLPLDEELTDDEGGGGGGESESDEENSTEYSYSSG